MCQCSATDGIALCLHAVQQVAVRLFNEPEVMFLMTLLYSQIKTATKTEANEDNCPLRPLKKR